MSNLPVLWVPPVTPPSPEDRPPRNRRTRNLLLGAAVLIATPLLIVAVLGQTGKGERVAEGPSTSGGSQPYIAAPATTPATGAQKETPADPAPTAAAVPTTPAPTSPAPSPSTSATTTSARTEAAPEPTPPTTVNGADGQPVRVIDIGKRPGEAPTTVVAQPPVKAAPGEPAKPQDSRAAAPATAAPIAPQAIRPSVDPTSPAKPATATATPNVTAPVTGEAATTAAPQSVPLPEKKPVARETTTPRARVAVQPPADGRTTSRDDFSERLGAIRRSESRRAVEAEPPIVDEEDDGVIVVPRRRGWGFLPPLFGSDEPPRPALRSFDPPDRLVRNRPSRAENCHYHAYPTDDMTFHRDVRCHWHDDPNDPSLRYVTPVQR